MNRSRAWISLGATAAAAGLNVSGGNFHGWILILAALAGVVIVFDLLAEPRRALLLLSFLLGLPILLSISTLYPPATGESALVAFLIALQIRLYFLRRVRKQFEANQRHAASLRASLPDKTTVFVDMDIEGDCAVADLQEGHLVRIRPDESIPADGQITFGSSFVDESNIEEKSEVRTKGMGSFVFAGTKNRNGSFIYRAAITAKQSFAHRLAGGLERGFPFESIFIPAFFLVEGVLFLGALIVYGFTGPRLAPLFNVFLLSSGTALAGALLLRDAHFLARSAQGGWWWRNLASMKKIAGTATLVTGSSGVLSEGRLRFSTALSLDVSEDGALRLLGPLARRLETDAAFAILQELQMRNIRLEIMDAFLEQPGGASGIITGEDIRWVDFETARLEGLPIARIESFARERLTAGEKVHLLFRGPVVAAALSFSDRVLPTAGQGVNQLKRFGVSCLLVTSEGPLPSRHLREELGITHFAADSGPAEAERLLEKLDAEGLSPTWVATPGWNLKGGIVPAALAPQLASHADCISLHADAPAIAGLVNLAQKHGSTSRSLCAWAAAMQLLLLALAPFVDPRLAALVSALPGLLLLARAPADF